MQGQFTKQQITFLAVAGVLVFVVVLVFVGILPGKRAKEAEEKIAIEVWGVDSRLVWAETIRSFQAAYPAVKVTYRELEEGAYEGDLINGLAAGEGPDVFMFDNNWLLEHRGKIVPIPQDQMALATFQGLFPQVAEQDFVLENRIYALPLYIDTLVLAYNRDHFDQGGITNPPETWESLDESIKNLAVLTEKGNLKRAAFAIGDSSESVENATDLVSLFLMQAGSSMVDSGLRNPTFDTPAGRAAFSKYVSYANSNSSLYSWSGSFGRSIEAFAKGNVSGVFVYSKQLAEIRAKNSLIDVAVGGMPQAQGSSAVNYPNYYGLAVSNGAENQRRAWEFAIFAATDRVSASNYAGELGLPPALRFLIEEQKEVAGKDGTLAKQALTARSWLQPNEGEVRLLIDQAIEAVLTGSLSDKQALSSLSVKIRELFRGT